MSMAMPSVALGVVAGAEPVHDDRRLVAHDPGVVAAGQRGDVAWLGDELGPVVHADRQPAADVILEVRCLAARRVGDRLDVIGPAPARLEHEPPDLPAADLEDLRAAVGELARLLRRAEALVLCLLHGSPPWAGGLARPYLLVGRMTSDIDFALCEDGPTRMPAKRDSTETNDTASRILDIGERLVQVPGVNSLHQPGRAPQPRHA